MATAAAASKRTLEGRVLPPIGLERDRQPPPSAHGKQAQEKQAVRRLPFPCSHRAITSAISLEPWSWRVFHQQHQGAGGKRPIEQCPGREPRVSWATHPQACPNQLGGGPLGRGGAHTGDPHILEKVTRGRHPQEPTSSPVAPRRTLVLVVGIALLPTPQTRTTRSWKGWGTGVPDRYLSTTSQGTTWALKPHAPVGPGSWRVTDGQ